MSSKMLTGMVLLVAMACGISAGVSESGRTLRVMVRKEFKLQPDGSYKEISSDKISPPSTLPTMDDLEESDPSVEESAPPPMYAYSPYSYNRGGGSSNNNNNDDYEAQGSDQYLQFTADDVQDVMRQLEASSYAVQHVQPSSQNFATYHQQEANYSGSESAPPTVRTVYYDSSKTQAAAAQPRQSYYVDPPRPVAAYSNYGGGSGAPKSIQEIIKKPQQSHRQPAAAADTQSNQFYSSPPKHEFVFSNYEATGPSSGGGGDYHTNYDQGPSVAYGGPTLADHNNQGGYNQGGNGGQSYGAPVAVHGNELHSGGWNGGGGSSFSHGGGHGGAAVGVLNSLVDTVSTVGQTGAKLSQSILTTTGDVGSQILHSGGKVVQQAVQQKGEKAKLIASTLSHVPARFSEVLRSKAHLATGFLDSGSRALGSVLNVKAQVVNQASNLLASKGKAANVVIRAGGNTASKVIVAKGKGLANLISSGGAATAALLNHKGNAVAKIAEVLSGLGNGGGGGGGGDGWSNDNNGGGGYDNNGGGLAGGYSENQAQYETYNNPAPSRVYDEQQIQDALKSVVQSPASSYGSPPAVGRNEEGGNGQAKLTSAFQSIYNTFKSVQPNAQSLFGSYSSPVEVTAKPEESSLQHQHAQPSFGQSASSIGESLSKMSNMLNSIASGINWLQPKQDKVV